MFRAVQRGYQPARMYAITIAQKLLKKKGYDPGPADGEMGSRTRGAIAAYRRKANLAGKQVVDKPLLHLLNAVTHRASHLRSPTHPPLRARTMIGKSVAKQSHCLETRKPAGRTGENLRSMWQRRNGGASRWKTVPLSPKLNPLSHRT